ncbi:YceI family protein [Frankia gtarii]|uniref:YceI family protein n=1 Tax=Frankia gtarii TaxID=2950102 RepID=UPI0021BE73A8|nr:YceI family protein [Frankia gtarii]
MATSGQAVAVDPLLRDKLAAGSLAGQWALDPARSTVRLRSRSLWGLAPITGSFGNVAGEGVVSATGEASGTVTVDAASIDTKMKKRDVHLRSADFFDSDVHPHIAVTVERLTLTADGATAIGTLQVRDRTQPLTFPVAVSVAGDSAVQLDAEVVIDRSDFGITWNQLGMASTKSTITVRAVFTQL